jgi:hypothetical protein
MEDDMSNPEMPGHGHRPEVEPGVVSVEHGQVMLDGPDGVAVAMTPEAALETGRRLIAAAERANAHQPG